MLLKVHPDNPAPRHLKMIADVLAKDGVVIIPTDTVYSLACNLGSTKGFEQLCRIKGIKPEKAQFSLICSDLSNIAHFANVDNAAFKILKKALPGPFTFILKASRNVPKLFQSNKKNIGIRVPDHPIPIEIVQLTGIPLITTSIHDEDEILDYTTDPEIIYENYKKVTDLVIDGGAGGNKPSTVVDFTEDQPVIIREGMGDFSIYS